MLLLSRLVSCSVAASWALAFAIHCLEGGGGGEDMVAMGVGEDDLVEGVPQKEMTEVRADYLSSPAGSGSCTAVGWRLRFEKEEWTRNRRDLNAHGKERDPSKTCPGKGRYCPVR